MSEHTYIGKLYNDDMQRTLQGQLSIWQDIENEEALAEDEKDLLIGRCLEEITFLCDLDIVTAFDAQQVLSTWQIDTPRRSELAQILQERVTA